MRKAIKFTTDVCLAVLMLTSGVRPCERYVTLASKLATSSTMSSEHAIEQQKW
jgi:hypothetical protein